MKKSLIISFLLLILTVSVFIGCSDDEKTTIIAAAEAEGYLLGYVLSYEDSYLEFYSDVFPMTNDNFRVDSIVIGDSLAEYNVDTYWNVYGDDNYHWTELEADSGEGPGYFPGDTAIVEFYNNNSMTTLSLELLSNDIEPTLISPISGDTIAIGDPLIITWNTMENADYYGIRTRYYQDSSGSSQYRYEIYTTKDTTFTIPGSSNTYNGDYYVYVMAINGPEADDAPNLDGAGLKGKFYSYTDNSSDRIYVGTGQANPVSGEQNEPNIDNTNISRIIMDKISGRKLQKDNH